MDDLTRRLRAKGTQHKRELAHSLMANKGPNSAMTKLILADPDAYNDDDILQHHGIKGMKWGVWNDETRARRMGRHGRKRKGTEEKPTGRKYDSPAKSAPEQIAEYNRTRNTAHRDPWFEESDYMATGKGVSKKEIADAEKKIGVKFAPDYKEFLEKCGWARVEGVGYHGLGSDMDDYTDSVINNTIEQRDSNKMWPDHKEGSLDDKYCINGDGDEYGMWQNSKGEVFAYDYGHLTKTHESFNDFLRDTTDQIRDKRQAAIDEAGRSIFGRKKKIAEAEQSHPSVRYKDLNEQSNKETDSKPTDSKSNFDRLSEDSKKKTKKMAGADFDGDKVSVPGQTSTEPKKSKWFGKQKSTENPLNGDNFKSTPRQHAEKAGSASNEFGKILNREGISDKNDAGHGRAVTAGGADDKRISSAEKELGTKFAPEYKEYLKKYGQVSVDYDHYNGLDGKGRPNEYNVVTNTKEYKRKMTMPEDMKDAYLVYNAGVDNLTLWQTPKGDMYVTKNDKVVQIPDKTLGDFIRDRADDADSWNVKRDSAGGFGNDTYRAWMSNTLAASKTADRWFEEEAKKLFWD